VGKKRNLVADGTWAITSEKGKRKRGGSKKKGEAQRGRRE